MPRALAAPPAEVAPARVAPVPVAPARVEPAEEVAPIRVAQAPLAPARVGRLRWRCLGGSGALGPGRQPIRRHGVGVEWTLRQQKQRVPAADLLSLYRVPQVAQIRRSPALRRVERNIRGAGRQVLGTRQVRNLRGRSAAGSAGSPAAAWTEMDCSSAGSCGAGGGGIGISGSACAGGAASVSAANAPSAPVATDSAPLCRTFSPMPPFAFFTVLLGASVLVLRLLHLCNV